MATVSGKYLEAKIGNTFISGNFAWTARESADKLDGTTGEDNGYDNPDDGVWSCTVDLKGFMDIGSGTYTPVRRGTLISNLKLFRSKNDANAAFIFPSSKVFESTQGGEVKGRVEWTATVSSKGVYQYGDAGQVPS